jgi:hypothetical protein
VGVVLLLGGGGCRVREGEQDTRSPVRYWWVNQNQTFRQEQAGGYLWSPKRNTNGVRNPFYETMREVSPGDVVFAFVDTVIAAIGVAQSYCFESPKPTEFGTTGQNWEDVGWKIRVQFHPAGTPGAAQGPY